MTPLDEPEIYLLITRHLAFETSAAEDEQLSEWIAQSKENELAFRQLKTIWLSGRRNPNGEGDAASAFADLKHQLAIAEYETVTSAMTRSKWSNKSKSWLVLAATSMAIVGMLFFLGFTQHWFFDQPVYLEKTAGVHEKDSCTLSDGTLVCLAPGSRIVYPEKFTSGSRSVRIWGQAFFKVTTNPHQPFMVAGGRLLTEVLGTSFLISAYDNQEQTSVALVEGKVNVTDSTHRFNYHLEPGRQLIYNNSTKETSVRDIEEKDNVTAWMSRQLVFNNITLAEAAKQIQAVYGVRMIFENKAASGSILWGRFKNKTLIDILETIKLAGNIQYTLQPNNTVLISKK